MKYHRKTGPPLVEAAVAVLMDCKKLSASCYCLCKVAWQLLPRQVLLGIILVSLAVVERKIEIGRFDSWIA